MLVTVIRGALLLLGGRGCTLPGATACSCGRQRLSRRSRRLPLLLRRLLLRLLLLLCGSLLGQLAAQPAGQPTLPGGGALGGGGLLLAGHSCLDWRVGRSCS